MDLIDLNGDALLDLVACRGQDNVGRVFRGDGDCGFELVQMLEGAGSGGLGEIMGSVGMDLVTIPNANIDPNIKVWPNLVFSPQSVAEDPERGGDAGLSVTPSVTSVGCWLEAAGGALLPGSLRVLSADGRVIYGTTVDAWPYWWGLRDDRGRAVPAGVYWILATEAGGTWASGRVVAVR